MDRLMHLLAPRTIVGFLLRFAWLVVLVAAANGLFDHVIDGVDLRPAGYYLFQSTIASGPLIAFFLATTCVQAQMQRELLLLARRDGLTGLNNRRSFLDLTHATRARKKRGILMMLDADRFKDINDTHGHQVGDDCLQTIAYTLQRNVLHTDVVGRIGGEEFAIYLHDATVAQARAIGARLTQPIAFGPDEDAHLTVTLSIGAAVSMPEDTLDEIFGQADDALYAAKKAGRARLVFWEGPSGLAVAT